MKAWVKRAGINKKITYHNLRHSAGTNLAYNGVDLLTISKILAHSSTKHTTRYVDAANEILHGGISKDINRVLSSYFKVPNRYLIGHNLKQHKIDLLHKTCRNPMRSKYSKLIKCFFINICELQFGHNK